MTTFSLIVIIIVYLVFLFFCFRSMDYYCGLNFLSRTGIYLYVISAVFIILGFLVSYDKINPKDCFGKLIPLK